MLSLHDMKSLHVTCILMFWKKNCCLWVEMTIEDPLHESLDDRRHLRKRDIRKNCTLEYAEDEIWKVSLLHFKRKSHEWLQWRNLGSSIYISLVSRELIFCTLSLTLNRWPVSEFLIQLIERLYWHRFHLIRNVANARQRNVFIDYRKVVDSKNEEGTPLGFQLISWSVSFLFILTRSLEIVTCEM